MCIFILNIFIINLTNNPIFNFHKIKIVKWLLLLILPLENVPLNKLHDKSWSFARDKCGYLIVDASLSPFILPQQFIRISSYNISASIAIKRLNMRRGHLDALLEKDYSQTIIIVIIIINITWTISHCQYLSLSCESLVMFV